MNEKANLFEDEFEVCIEEDATSNKLIFLLKFPPKLLFMQFD